MTATQADVVSDTMTFAGRVQAAALIAATFVRLGALVSAVIAFMLRQRTARTLVVQQRRESTLKGEERAQGELFCLYNESAHESLCECNLRQRAQRIMAAGRTNVNTLNLHMPINCI